MAFKFIAISAISTVLSFLGVQFGSKLSWNKLYTDGLIGKNLIHLEDENAIHVTEPLLGPYTTIGLLANFMINAFILLNLSLKVSSLLSVSELSNYYWEWWILQTCEFILFVLYFLHMMFRAVQDN